MTTYIDNAKITSAVLEHELDHGGFLTIWLNLDFGNAHQGFGGYVLGIPHDPNDNAEYMKKRVAELRRANYMGVFVEHLFKVTETHRFDKLVGKIIRVESKDGLIVRIGHPLKDIWFNPKEEMDRLREEVNDGP